MEGYSALLKNYTFVYREKIEEEIHGERKRALITNIRL